MALDGKVAIVTGASRGIGEYIALHLARAGAAVVVAARTEQVTDKRLPGTIHTVAEQIIAEGGRALAVRLDVRDPDSISACVQRTVEEFGRIDIVVNNAAILVPGTLEAVQPRHIDLIWQIDLRGPLLLMRDALPHLKAAGGGHIINISSVAAVFPGPGPYSSPRGGGQFYGMVKAGLERYSQGLAMEVQADNISVNVLSPTRSHPYARKPVGGERPAEPQPRVRAGRQDGPCGSLDLRAAREGVHRQHPLRRGPLRGAEPELTDRASRGASR